MIIKIRYFRKFGSMKKVVFIFLAMLLVSCSASKTVSSNEGLFEVLTQRSDGGGNIRFFEILTEPAEILMLRNDPHLKDKINPDDIKHSNYVVLNMGEKNTGGYSIGIEKVVETETNILITVKDHHPYPDAMLIQLITYPYTVVKINSKKEIIIQ